MLRFTPHFSYAELIHTDQKLSNDPFNEPEEVCRILLNLSRLAHVLEHIRSSYGRPLRVNSAYRSASVNHVVGGVRDSKHRKGLAADIPHDVPREILETYKNLGYLAKYIDEKTWWHIEIFDICGA